MSKQKQDDNPSILYILSPSYSGSTLLTFMLAAHPRIGTVGELKATSMGDVSDYICSCGSLLTQCEFWTRLVARMNSPKDPFSLQDFQTHFNSGSRLFRRFVRLSARNSPLGALSALGLACVPNWKQRLEFVGNRNRLIIKSICDLQGATVFLDGSKDPERLNQFLRMFPNSVKAIHLVRDARGISNSYMKHNGVDIRSAAREWLSVDISCQDVLGRMRPEDFLRIRYEDFCEEPSKFLGQIFRFVGLDAEKQEWRSSPLQFHILGNEKMRLSGAGKIALDEKWRRELKPNDLSTFTEVAGPRNSAYGYGD